MEHPSTVSKRDWFAAQALIGLLARGEAFEPAVRAAYDVANLMMRQSEAEAYNHKET